MGRLQPGSFRRNPVVSGHTPSWPSIIITTRMAYLLVAYVPAAQNADAAQRYGSFTRAMAKREAVGLGKLRAPVRP